MKTHDNKQEAAVGADIQRKPSQLLDGQLAFTPSEFASLFNKSQTWGYRQLYAGRIKKVAGSQSILIPRGEVERLLSQTVFHGEK